MVPEHWKRMVVPEHREIWVVPKCELVMPEWHESEAGQSSDAVELFRQNGEFVVGGGGGR